MRLHQAVVSEMLLPLLGALVVVAPCMASPPAMAAASVVQNHEAPALRSRAACPQLATRQGASASPELVRSLIVCMLEDNTGVYAGKTINVDVLEFRMGRAIRNRDAPISLRYAAPNTTLYNATMRFNQRIYGSSDVVHFDDAQYNYTVYVDLHDRWAVGSSRIKSGDLRRTALPR